METLTIQELIQLVEGDVMTPEEITSLHERLDKAETKFAEDSHRRNANSPEFLNYQFTI